MTVNFWYSLVFLRQIFLLKVGLEINANKTKYMKINTNGGNHLQTLDNTTLENVDQFQYLGSWTNVEKDIATRKALAWTAMHKMKNIWKSSLSRNIKIRLFHTAIEPILLYGCESWTLNSRQMKSLDGCYTRMLRSVLNISWQQHMLNTDLYQKIPQITSKIRNRRMKLAGHCLRDTSQITSKLVLWTPARGHVSQGRPTKTYIDLLKQDTGLNSESEVMMCMKERKVWRSMSGSEVTST